MNKNQLTEEQRKIIESNFDKVYEGVSKALLIIELVKSSLVDEDSDSINENTCPYDTREALKIATEYLKPIKSYTSEVSCGGIYIFEDMANFEEFKILKGYSK